MQVTFESMCDANLALDNEKVNMSVPGLKLDNITLVLANCKLENIKRIAKSSQGVILNWLDFLIQSQ